MSGCLLLLGGVATAGNPLSRPAKREAREHLDRGNRLYHTRSFEEAIIEYKAGALIEPATVFDYNLAQSYRQLGRHKEAIWYYERFLNYGQPDGELLGAVNAFLQEMRAQLANRAQISGCRAMAHFSSAVSERIAYRALNPAAMHAVVAPGRCPRTVHARA